MLTLCLWNLGIKEYSSWPTIPQLYINVSSTSIPLHSQLLTPPQKEFIGGCDILVSMHQSGELAELLDKEGVLAPAEEAKPETETKSDAPPS